MYSSCSYSSQLGISLAALALFSFCTVADEQPLELDRSNVAQYVTVQAEDDARVHGVLVEAPPEERKETAFLHMHPFGDHGYFLQDPLAESGYSSLSLVSRYNTNQRLEILEKLPLDLAAGAKLLLSRGYKQIVLMGTSASGPLLSLYQDLAENEEERKRVYGQNPPDLPRARGLILGNPTPGVSVSFLRRLDPSIVDEDDPSKINPDLDMYNPKNWVSGDPETFEGVHYSVEFLEKYRKAQSQRMNRLTEWGEKKLQGIEQGRGRFIDDELMVIKGVRANPWYLDLSLGGTKVSMVTADPAVGPDGRGERPVRNAKETNRSLRGAAIHSVRSFLSYRSIASTHPFKGLDVSSSNGVTSSHLSRISIPILFLIGASDPQVYLADFDENFSAIRDEVDKTAVFIKGGDHSFGPTSEHRQQAIRAALSWVEKRFPD